MHFSKLSDLLVSVELTVNAVLRCCSAEMYACARFKKIYISSHTFGSVVNGIKLMFAYHSLQIHRK